MSLVELPAGLLLDTARPGHFALDVHVGGIPAGQGRVAIKWRTFVVSVLGYVYVAKLVENGLNAHIYKHI